MDGAWPFFPWLLFILICSVIVRVFVCICGLVRGAVTHRQAGGAILLDQTHVLMVGLPRVTWGLAPVVVALLRGLLEGERERKEKRERRERDRERKRE